MNLLPKDERFFEYFHQQSGILRQASDLLASGLKGGYAGICQIVKRIEALERSGDDVTHKIFDHLRSTFITPFDPEDVQALASSLDNVLDTIEDATFRITAYRVDPIPEAAIELGQILTQSCQAIERALQALHKKESVMEACIEINRLEEQADAIQRTMLISLFATKIDAVELIKLKDLYEALESATDRCEDVADVVQNVSVKNS